jgi:hypothetical protein
MLDGAKGSTTIRVDALMYANRPRPGAKHGTGVVSAEMRERGIPLWLAGILAVLLLIGVGAAYRAGASVLQRVLNTPIELPVPLRALPLNVNGWTGEELPIPATTQDYMETNFADDFISRRYTNMAQGLWADLYVVYCSSRPSGILGHRPRKCMPAHGWIYEETVRSEIASRSGRPINCLIHRFNDPSAYQQIIVLTFYVLNGQITLSENEFSGFLGRRPNISGDPARYVAQVQLSSTLENSVRVAASDLVETILAFLPDRDGRVTASDLGDGFVRGQDAIQSRQ